MWWIAMNSVQVDTHEWHPCCSIDVTNKSLELQQDVDQWSSRIQLQSSSFYSCLESYNLQFGRQVLSRARISFADHELKIPLPPSARPKCLIGSYKVARRRSSMASACSIWFPAAKHACEQGSHPRHTSAYNANVYLDGTPQWELNKVTWWN